jgi:hypothetical protein
MGTGTPRSNLGDAVSLFFDPLQLHYGDDQMNCDPDLLHARMAFANASKAAKHGDPFAIVEAASARQTFQEAKVSAAVRRLRQEINPALVNTVLARELLT